MALATSASSVPQADTTTTAAIVAPAPVPVVTTVPPPPGSTQTPVVSTVPSAPTGSVSASPPPPAIVVPAVFSGVPNYPSKMSPWQLQFVAYYNDARTNQHDYDAIMNTWKLIQANGGPVAGFASNPWTPAYQAQYAYMVATVKAAATALAGVPRPGGALPTPAVSQPTAVATPKVTMTPVSTAPPVTKAAPSTGTGGAVTAAPLVANVVTKAQGSATGLVQEVEQGVNVFVGWLGSIFAKRA